MSESDNQEAEGNNRRSSGSRWLDGRSSFRTDKVEDEGQTIEHRADAEVEDQPSEEETFERPDFIPEKFWDEKEGQDLEKIMKSYDNLEKQFSQGKHKAPKEYDTEVLTEAGLRS